MKVHEYQGKQLFGEYGVPVPVEMVVSTADEAAVAAEKIGGTVVIKAQVLVGGRGKAGGVKLAKSPDEARQRAAEILALTIKELPVEKVLVAPAADIKQEFYLGLVLDRNTKSVLLMVSKAGGVDIEELAVSSPDEILKLPIDPVKGIQDAELKKTLSAVFETPKMLEQAHDTVTKLYQLFVEKDCSLVEINPYGLVENETLLALDAKVNFDDNALSKHPEIEALKNLEEYSADEIEANKHGLSFVSLDGEIGCIVNGAGLAMATLDIIKLYGGSPANFLDVGGSSNPEKVLNALSIILGNPKVKAVLINIFGGITRCDDIAKGILMAMDQIDIKLPLVIRLIGTNDKEGRKLLADRGLEVAESLSEAVEKVVSVA